MQADIDRFNRLLLWVREAASKQSLDKSEVNLQSAWLNERDQRSDETLGVVKVGQEASRPRVNDIIEAIFELPVHVILLSAMKVGTDCVDQIYVADHEHDDL